MYKYFPKWVYEVLVPEFNADACTTQPIKMWYWYNNTRTDGYPALKVQPRTEVFSSIREYPCKSKSQQIYELTVFTNRSGKCLDKCAGFDKVHKEMFYLADELKRYVIKRKDDILPETENINLVGIDINWASLPEQTDIVYGFTLRLTFDVTHCPYTCEI